jgi:hypothetical protein
MCENWAFLGPPMSNNHGSCCYYKKAYTDKLITSNLYSHHYFPNIFPEIDFVDQKCSFIVALEILKAS